MKRIKSRVPLCKAIRNMSKSSIYYYKLGGTLIALSLAITYILCREDMLAGGIGLELYYSPYIEKILSSFLVFWICTFLIDLIEKETIRRN